MIWSSVTRVGTGHLKCVVLEQFPAEGEQWDCNKCFKRLLYSYIRVP